MLFYLLPEFDCELNSKWPREAGEVDIYTSFSQISRRKCRVTTP